MFDSWILGLAVIIITLIKIQTGRKVCTVMNIYADQSGKKYRELLYRIPGIKMNNDSIFKQAYF